MSILRLLLELLVALLRGPAATSGSSPAPADAAVTSLDNDWLRDFYKECGREATLAYTTLNQMKNWAITVQGAIIAAVAAFARTSGTSSETVAFPVAVGSVLAYVFTLRFFVRAILCYINLSRWNTLQAAVVELKLVPRDRSPQLTPEQLEDRLRGHIQNLYHRWLSPSPLDRTSQIASNLKLGFGILMTVPTLMIIWSGSLLWGDSLVRGLIVFAAGATMIEAIDFFTSSYFNTVEAAAARKTRQHIFPAPKTSLRYIARWVWLLILCSVVALWPWLEVLFVGSGPLPPVR